MLMLIWTKMFNHPFVQVQKFSYPYSDKETLSYRRLGETAFKHTALMKLVPAGTAELCKNKQMEEV